MRWLNLFSRSEKKYTTLDLFKEVFGSFSRSGRSVTAAQALELAVVFGCVRVLAEGVAQVPLKLMRSSDRTREPAREHPLYDVLFRRPNEWMTSFEFRELLMFHTVLVGNHYSYKNIVNGNVVELLPFDQPGSMTVKRSRDYRLSYEYRTPDGKTQTFPQEVIWHVRGPSWNSWMGLDAVKLARDVIGLAMDMQDQQSQFYRDGAQPSGIYSVEGTLTEKQHSDLTKWVKTNVSGPENAGKVLVLDRAGKFTQLSMKASDAQTLESRKYQVEETCRIFRVMPLMIGFSDKTATYASAEQMFLAHVVHTLAPWYERLEQSIDVNLLTKKDRESGVYVKFIEEGLLRGALRDTALYLKELCAIGIMTRNEARDKLDMNPIAELEKPLTPANIVGKPKDSEEPPKEE